MKIQLKPPQGKVFTCEQRFRILVAGRRFGKTYFALIELIRAAWGPGRTAWYVAPTYRQAKMVSWKTLKWMTKSYWAKQPNETELTIELISGGTISLRGADNYESLRGNGLDFIVLDEFASMAPGAWTEVLRPALADRQGRALFIGTPHGHNHFFDLHEAAKDLPELGNVPVHDGAGRQRHARGTGKRKARDGRAHLPPRVSGTISESGCGPGILRVRAGAQCAAPPLRSQSSAFLGS